MPRLAILEGYSTPFGAYRKKRRHSKKRRAHAKRRRSSKRGKSKRGMKQQTRMRLCARSWGKRHRGSYKSFMKKCLGGKIRVKR